MIFFVDTDGHGRETIFRTTSPEDLHPQPLARKFALDREDPTLWPIVKAALTGTNNELRLALVAAKQQTRYFTYSDPIVMHYRELTPGAVLHHWDGHHWDECGNGDTLESLRKVREVREISPAEAATLIARESVAS
jgi:hypothetical protein